MRNTYIYIIICISLLVNITEGKGQNGVWGRINHKGEIAWSESTLCPGFATVNDKFEDIVKKAKEWSPCRKCKGWDKVKNSTDPTYIRGRAILERNHL